MEIIENPQSSRKEIEACIKRNGHAPEHNFGYWMWLEEKGRNNIFLKFQSNEGILAQYIPKQNCWFFVSLPIAKEKNRIQILVEAISNLFKKNIKKINIELPSGMKREFSKQLKNSSFKIGFNNYVYHWPVFDMRQWGGEGLKGRKWKKLRNIKNRFYKNNKVKVADSRKISKEELKKIVHEWIKRRTNQDLPFFQRYLNMIDLGFDGVKYARTLIINRQPSSITAGWEIPNSNDYYSGVGIYNYRFENIGELSNLDDLFFLKAKNYEKVDFGGSGKTLLKFKMKFRPSYIYKTYSFPVVRRK